MARSQGKKLELSAEEAEMLKEGKEYEIIPNRDGIYLLVEKALISGKEGKEQHSEKEKILPHKLTAAEEEKQQVIGLIRKTRLADLVEGKFEQTLNEKQKKALLELVSLGRVFVFKLNETYKKGVYRVKEESAREIDREKKASESFDAPEKQFADYSLKEDGFIIIRGKENASYASSEYAGQIKEGLLRGIKSFDGNYYLVQNDLLQAYIDKTMHSFLTKKNQTLEELSQTLNASKRLAIIVCEFLKEEGELLEKKKGTYQHIN